MAGMSLSDWKEIPLEEAIEKLIDYRGKTPEKTTSGIPLITAKIVKDGKINTPQEFIDEDDYETWMVRGFPKKGDVVLTTEAPLGEVATIDNENIALAQRIVVLRGKEGLLNNTYLKYHLMSHDIQHQLRSRASGTTVLGIKQSELRKVILKIPSIKIQEKIVNVLDLLFQKRMKNESIIDSVNSIINSLYRSWFIDFDPVIAKIEGKLPYGMEQETADLFPDKFDDSKFGKLPKGWRITKLEDIIDYKEGPGIRNWQYVYDGNGVNFINIRCIGNNDINIKDASQISHTEAYGKYSHFHLKEKDVVISTSGTLGRYAIVRREHLPLILNTSVIRFRPKNNCNLSFMLGYMETGLQNELLALASGSVQLNFGPMHLQMISLIYPPKPILDAYEKAVIKLIEIKTQLQQDTCLILGIRDTILPRLMSGELSVS
jgi:type I restriction enzyme, S subunit